MNCYVCLSFRPPMKIKRRWNNEENLKLINQIMTYKKNILITIIKKNDDQNK